MTEGSAVAYHITPTPPPPPPARLVLTAPTPEPSSQVQATVYFTAGGARCQHLLRGNGGFMSVPVQGWAALEGGLGGQTCQRGEAVCKLMLSLR